jgi:hypothetical protein
MLLKVKINTSYVIFVENLNLITMEYIKEIERGREWRLRFFKWFDYMSLRPQDVEPMGYIFIIFSLV